MLWNSVCNANHGIQNHGYKNSIIGSINIFIVVSFILLDPTFARIGQNISTKAVGTWEREDITDSYKYPEKSDEERDAMLKALRQSESLFSRYYLNDDFNDVIFNFEMRDDIIIGQPFRMAVSKAFMHFIRQRRILFNNVPLISSKTLVCVSFPKSQHYYYSNKKSLVESEKTETNNKVQVDFVEVVKDKTKFAWHLIIIAVGLSGVCVMFYYIFSELFSNTSPNSVYSKAFNTVKNDPRIIDMYGSSLKAFGDESGRRRRGHIRNVIFMKNGVEHMKMKFYIQGDNGKGTVHLEVRKNLEGQWVYRYLFVQLTHRPKSIIVLEDNRDIDNKIFVNPQDSEELMPPNWPNKLFQ